MHWEDRQWRTRELIFGGKGSLSMSSNSSALGECSNRDRAALCGRRHKGYLKRAVDLRCFVNHAVCPFTNLLHSLVLVVDRDFLHCDCWYRLRRQERRRGGRGVGMASRKEGARKKRNVDCRERWKGKGWLGTRGMNGCKGKQESTGSTTVEQQIEHCQTATKTKMSAACGRVCVFFLCRQPAVTGLYVEMVITYVE